MDFDTPNGVAEVIFRTGYVVGWNRLKALNETLKELHNRGKDGVIKITIENNLMLGNENQIQLLSNALGGDSSEERDNRLAAVTDALFRDILSLDQMIVFIFDHFEKSATPTKQWIASPFLSRIAATPNVRVVIGGQGVPIPNVEWSHISQEHNLLGVHDPHDWMPIVSRLNKTIPSDNPISYLLGVCRVLEGHPTRIMTLIESL